MVWRAKISRPLYADKTLKTRLKFAWLPTYIEGYIVWLSSYEVLQMFVIKLYPISDGKAFQTSEWVSVSKALIK